MGLLDRLEKKKALSKPTEDKKIETPKPKPITKRPSVSVKKDETLLDSYDILVGDVEFKIAIKKRGVDVIYECVDFEAINAVLKKISEEDITNMKNEISNRLINDYKQIKEVVSNYISRKDVTLRMSDIEYLAKYFYLVVGRLGLLEIALADTKLEEVMVNGYNIPMFVFHKKFQMCETNISFDEGELNRIIESIARMANRTIDARTPLLDAFLPDGSRVNATTSDVTMNGATLTIRKFSSTPLTITDLINFGSLNIDVAAFLWQAVEGYFGAKPANTLIAGGTGSGKTTLLNVVSLFAMHTDRIITIEDTPELQIPHKHVIKMVTRPARPGFEGYEITMNDLIKNTLRMRPDRIIVGEIRGEEANSLLVAMNTGHDGALSYDEVIYLSDGNIVKIGEFVDKFFTNRDVKKENNGFEWTNIENENIFIKSFNKSTLKLRIKE